MPKADAVTDMLTSRVFFLKDVEQGFLLFDKYRPHQILKSDLKGDELMFVNTKLKGMGDRTGGIMIYGKGDDVYGDDCYDLYGIHMVMKGDESNDLSSRRATK